VGLKNVLIISEHQSDHLLITESLERASPRRFTTTSATALERPIDALMSESVDAVILAQAPETEYLLRLAQKQSVSVPIIVLLSEASQTTQRRYKDLGARDFLQRSYLNDELLHRIIDYSIELGEARQEIQRLSKRDPLTGALNRTGMRAHVERAIERAERYHFKTGILYINVDRFTQINEDLGETAADQVIKTVHSRLAARKRSTDSIARIGGDEFVLVLEDVHDAENLHGIANMIMGKLSEPIAIEGEQLTIDVSLGGCICPDHGSNFEELFEAARTCMLQAKAVSGSKFFLYSEEISFGLQGHNSSLAADLRQAMRRDQLELHFQPRIDLRTQEVVSLEALLRWNHPARGLITPDDFLPLCESMGMMRKLGYRVTEKACEAIQWLDQHNLDHIDIAVNVSFSQFQDEHFADVVKDIVNRYGIEPRRLEFELTESTVLKCPVDTRVRMDELRNLGHSFSLDDFGTGFSQLSHMTDLPISALKIDRSFVEGVPGNRHHQAVCMMIIDMAQRLDLLVIAEGAEGQEQIDFLQSVACHQVQGHYYSPALRLEDIPGYIKERSYRIALH
jgi:diguanylate cyclase (GGDEF)-like protein